jgi:hypothetical protein
MMLAEDSDVRVRRSAQRALELYRDEAQLSFFARVHETGASK